MPDNPSHVQLYGPLYETDLGRLVVSMTAAFESDPAVRSNLIRWGVEDGFEPMAPEYYEVQFASRSRLRDWPSPMIIRERFRAYLDYLDCVLNLVLGKEVPLIATPKTQARIIQAEALRSYWLGQPGYVEKVRRMHGDVVSLVNFLSHQAILIWIHRASRIVFEPAPFLAGLSGKAIVTDFSPVDSSIVRHSAYFLDNCARSYAAVQSDPEVKTGLGSLFFCDARQIGMLYVASRGAELDPKNFDVVKS